MAIASRFDDIGTIFVSLDLTFAFTSEHAAGICVVPSAAMWLLERTEACQGGITVDDLKFGVEQAVMSVGKEQTLAILIIDTKSGEHLHAEKLFFHHSFFVPFFDFARSERFPPFMAKGYEKPEFLAVFTHVYNEDDMLMLWERHYSKLTPHRHLYVIDHGSTSPPREWLDGRTNVVRIPRGTVDHANISGFCNYFQRFLLTQYKWVVHVDCDELMIYEGGVEELRTKLAAAEPNIIIRPQHAYDLIHNYRSEPPLLFSKHVSMQRDMLKMSPGYKKPIIASVPTTWMMGFHQVFEHYSTIELESLWIVHLAFADLDRTLEVQTKWKNLAPSEADSAFVPQTGRVDALVPLRHKFDVLLQAEATEIPEWMRGMF